MLKKYAFALMTAIVSAVIASSFFLANASEGFLPDSGATNVNGNANSSSSQHVEVSQNSNIKIASIQSYAEDAGSKVAIPVTYTGDEGVLSLNLTMTYYTNLIVQPCTSGSLQVVAVGDNENSNLAQRKTIQIYYEKGNVKDGDVLFTLNFKLPQIFSEGLPMPVSIEDGSLAWFYKSANDTNKTEARLYNGGVNTSEKEADIEYGTDLGTAPVDHDNVQEAPSENLTPNSTQLVQNIDDATPVTAEPTSEINNSVTGDAGVTIFIVVASIAVLTCILMVIVGKKKKHNK